MSSTNIYFGVENLPIDVMPYIDDKFYDFVKQVLGQTFSDLLKIFQINSASCFLMTDDVSDMLNMDINHKALTDLKKDICFELKNGSSITKPGIKTGFKCLKDVLLKMNEMTLKELKQKRKQQASFITSASMALIDHKQFVSKSVKQWCLDNKSNLDFQELDLKNDGIDFTSYLVFDNKLGVHGSITCKCGVSIKLTTNNGKIQLSSFYKHVKYLGCTHMIKLKKQDNEKKQKQTTTTPLSSTSTAQQQMTTPVVGEKRARSHSQTRLSVKKKSRS